jgi:hypothetical protein
MLDLNFIVLTLLSGIGTSVMLYYRKTVWDVLRKPNIWCIICFPLFTSDESEVIDHLFHSLDVIAEYRPIDISSIKSPQRQQQQQQQHQQLSPKHRLISSECISTSLPQRHELNSLHNQYSQEISDSQIS